MYPSLRSLCLFIICVISLRDVNCQISVHIVNSVRLKPMPYKINDRDLLEMKIEQRRNLCEDRFKDVQLPIFPPKHKDYFVPGAHHYELGSENWLAIRCPSVPAMYVASEKMNDGDQWYIKIVRPPRIGKYEFVLETAKSVQDVQPGDIIDQRSFTLEESRSFIQIEMEERWFLCYEAQKYIRYDVSKETIYKVGIGNPKFYKFEYDTDWSDIYLGLKCLSQPDMYVRTSRYSDSDYVMIITLVGSKWIGKDFNVKREIEYLPPPM